jgi:hypothetical protein
MGVSAMQDDRRLDSIANEEMEAIKSTAKAMISRAKEVAAKSNKLMQLSRRLIELSKANLKTTAPRYP